MEKKARRRFKGNAIIATIVASMNIVFPLNTIVLSATTVSATNNSTTNDVQNEITAVDAHIDTATTSNIATKDSFTTSITETTTSSNMILANTSQDLTTTTVSNVVSDKIECDNTYVIKISIPQTLDCSNMVSTLENEKCAKPFENYIGVNADNFSVPTKIANGSCTTNNIAFNPVVQPETSTPVSSKISFKEICINIPDTKSVITQEEIDALVESILQNQKNDKPSVEKNSDTKANTSTVSTSSQNTAESENENVTNSSGSTSDITDVSSDDNTETFDNVSESSEVSNAENSSNYEQSYDDTIETSSDITVASSDEEINSEETDAQEDVQADNVPSSSWDGPVLTAFAGTVEGPSGKETYYNLDMTGVISIMRNCGYEGEYWVRDDGVKMLGDYIMCAANLEIRPRGSLIETSLGTAIVCDTGGFAYSNPYQLDIAVTW